jgi:hypothetical protein
MAEGEEGGGAAIGAGFVRLRKPRMGGHVIVM